SAELIGGAHASGFLGEVLSVQVALQLDEDSPGSVRIRLTGPLADRARVHAVRRVPVATPAPAAEHADEHYLVTTPGEYPDLLEPLSGECVHLAPGRWESLWIDILGTEETDAGDHALTITLCG